MKPRKLLMIVNPRAGKSKSHGPLFDAAAALSQSGYLLSIHMTTAPGDAAETARREGGRYDVVVAVGGDGTLNEVASGLVDLRRAPLLGYLPQGSTNDFAASLHISGEPAEAAAAIARNVPRRLDVGRWNGKSFLYVASFGAFTRSSYAAPQAAKNALGHFAYILEGMKDLNSLRPYRVRITADGEELDGEYCVSLDHEMSKSHFISWMARSTSDRFELVKLYPEGGCQVRFPRRGTGCLYWYCNRHGLFRQRLSHGPRTALG